MAQRRQQAQANFATAKSVPGRVLDHTSSQSNSHPVSRAQSAPSSLWVHSLAPILEHNFCAAPNWSDFWHPPKPGASDSVHKALPRQARFTKPAIAASEQHRTAWPSVCAAQCPATALFDCSMNPGSPYCTKLHWISGVRGCKSGAGEEAMKVRQVSDRLLKDKRQ